MKITGLKLVGTRLVTEIKPTNSELEEAFSSARFVELGPVHPGPRRGLVTLVDPLDPDFSDWNSWSFSQYVVLGLRVDSRKVPALTFKMLLDARVTSWCSDHQRERCPAKVKAEIKEKLLDEVLPKVLPSAKLIPIVWDLQRRHLVIQSTSDADVEWVLKTLGDALGHGNFRPWSCRDWAGAKADEDLGTSTPGSEFLLWLWFMGEKGQVSFGDMWVDEKVAFSHDDESGATTILQGACPAAMPEAGVALSNGKKLVLLHLTMRKDDREFSFEIDRGFHIKKLSLPAVVKGDGAIYDIMFLYEELDMELAKLFGTFLDIRNSPAWDDTLAAIQVWADAKAQR